MKVPARTDNRPFRTEAHADATSARKHRPVRAVAGHSPCERPIEPAATVVALGGLLGSPRATGVWILVDMSRVLGCVLVYALALLSFALAGPALAQPAAPSRHEPVTLRLQLSQPGTSASVETGLLLYLHNRLSFEGKRLQPRVTNLSLQWLPTPAGGHDS
jgi:hypothetical protein